MAANKPSVSMQKRIRSDRLMLSSSDDNIMLKQIQATHVPDGRVVDVKPLLHLVEDIFKRASATLDAIETPVVATQAHQETLQDMDLSATHEALALVIDRVANEITCKQSSGENAHSTTMAILNMLNSYAWDAKLVITLAAFAMSYGEFWLIAQNYTSNHLAKSLAILKQLPDILKHTSLLKPRYEAIQNIIKVMLDLTKCIAEFKDLPSQYISTDFAALATAGDHIPVAVYWTIKSIIACSSQIQGLVAMGHEHLAMTTEAWELSTLAHKLGNMLSHLQVQLGKCYKHVDEKIYHESYQNLLHLFEVAHIDNMKVLKALIYAKDDLQPLVDGATKKKVDIDVLRGKYVLLLISELNIPQEELAILDAIYNQSRQESQYDVVWLPILDTSIPWTNNRQQQFERIQGSMPWYTVENPSLIDKAVNNFVKEIWHFAKKPILVVLDPQGRVACPNALHMMWIWGSVAFPFTTSKEEALWKGESWRLELLVDDIDPFVSNWITEGRYICLYGGEDTDWIRKFTKTARAVAQTADIPLEMVYVGRSNPKEKVARNISTIVLENLSHYWEELSLIWYFWVRIESMWHSKNQLGRTAEDDPIMREIMTLLSYDGSGDGWALLSKGSTEMVNAKGSTFLTCFSDYSAWKMYVEQKGFLPALKDRLAELHTPHHCNRLVLPGTAGKVPQRVICSECGRQMERFIMYRCCDE